MRSCALPSDSTTQLSLSATSSGVVQLSLSATSSDIVQPSLSATSSGMCATCEKLMLSLYHINITCIFCSKLLFCMLLL